MSWQGVKGDAVPSTFEEEYLPSVIMKYGTCLELTIIAIMICSMFGDFYIHIFVTGKVGGEGV